MTALSKYGSIALPVQLQICLNEVLAHLSNVLSVVVISQFAKTVKGFLQQHLACLAFQTKVRELQDKGQEAKVDSTPTIEFDFKAKFAETKATAKVSSDSSSSFGIDFTSTVRSLWPSWSQF